MTIAFLTPEYPHRKCGPSAGLGTSIKNLATGLVANGVKVVVVVVGQKTSQVVLDNGVILHLLEHRKYPYLGFFLYRKLIQNYLNNVIRKERIDLVEAPDWTGLTAFMNLKAPLVIRFHGSDAYFCKLEGRRQKRKNFWFENSALRGANEFVSVSRFTARQTSQIFNLKGSITVIPNGINIEEFRPSDKEEDFNTILYFGTIIRKKGVLELPKIFNLVVEEYPDARLIFLGPDVADNVTGKSTRLLVDALLTEKAKTRVVWLPKLPYEEVQQEIARAEVIALPSFAEAFPMTWLEAMAMGKAMVTSNIGWAEELMIDGKTGYTVDPRNHGLFSSRIKILLKHKSLRKEIGRNCRQHILQNFSSAKITERNIQFYKKIINSNGAEIS